MALVIHMSKECLTKKYPNLTSKMVVALLAAIEKQKSGLPYGSCDIKGSFTSLITRGLIVMGRVFVHGQWESQWRVSDKAIEF